MIFCYHALVKKSNASTITAIYVPDFKLKLTGDLLSNIEEQGLQDFIDATIKTQLEKKLKRHEAPPTSTPLQEMCELHREKHDLWVAGYANMNYKKGFFTQFLPFFGGAATMLSAVCGTVVSTASLEVMMQDMFSEGAINALSLMLSANISFLGLIIYFGSQSSESLTQIGESLDRWVQSKFYAESSQAESPVTGAGYHCSRACTKSIMTKLLVASDLSLNSICGGVISYSQLNALGDQFDNEPGSIISAGLYDFSKWAFIIAGGISGLIFTANSFGMLGEKMAKRSSSSADRVRHYDFDETERKLEIDPQMDVRAIDLSGPDMSEREPDDKLVVPGLR
jgi:hypothetical protein